MKNYIIRYNTEFSLASPNGWIPPDGDSERDREREREREREMDAERKYSPEEMTL
jgi:hypothetical protein